MERSEKNKIRIRINRELEKNLQEDMKEPAERNADQKRKRNENAKIYLEKKRKCKE